MSSLTTNVPHHPHARQFLSSMLLTGVLSTLAGLATATEHQLSLTVVDEASGNPLPCRVSLIDAEGRSIPLTTKDAGDAVSYDVTNWINPQSV